MSTASESKRIVLSAQPRQRPLLRGSYDAAQTTDDNANHWAAADALSANAAHNPFVRHLLRMRSRYEFANNTYCRGMLLTLANDVIGCGPSLQLLSDSSTANNFIEHEFARWCREVRLARKLRTARLARAMDGESFVVMGTNGALRHRVKLDVRLIECDQVSTPNYGIDPRQRTDGIVYDDWGNPMAYHVLRQHPGEIVSWQGQTYEYDTVRAEHMLHLVRHDRSGYTRGVPEIAPALPLYAQLRRYTLAVIAAAETAADIAGVIKSDLPPEINPDDVDRLSPGDLVDIVRRTLLTLPDGHDISQLKAEQPTTTYGDFKREIINEIARCLNMPYNVAAGNSSKYNYASGRLDYQTYYKAIEIDRGDFELDAVDPIFFAWLREASRIPGYLPVAVPADPAELEHAWMWPGREHVDPQKEANAQDTRLGNHTTNLAREFARAGLDWEKELRQRAKEMKLIRALGLTAAEAKPRRDDPDDDEPIVEEEA